MSSGWCLVPKSLKVISMNIETKRNQTMRQVWMEIRPTAVKRKQFPTRIVNSNNSEEVAILKSKVLTKLSIAMTKLSIALLKVSQK